MGVPLPDLLSIEELLTRGLPPFYADKLRVIEAELDVTWPLWRQKKPFDHLQYDHKARVKWLLKRQSLLSNTTNGMANPLDWDVLIVPDRRNPHKCYAHPVMPSAKSRETTREPPSPFFVGGQLDPRILHSRPAANSPEDVANKTGFSVELCKEALACKPPRWMDTSVAWVNRWVAARSSEEPGEAPPASSETVVVLKANQVAELTSDTLQKPLARPSRSTRKKEPKP